MLKKNNYDFSEHNDEWGKLYFGGVKDLKNFKDSYIVHILTKKENNKFQVVEKTHGIFKSKYTKKSLYIPNLQANDKSCILDHLVPVIKFIDEGIRNKKKVLIHCYTGGDRAKLFFCAYIGWKLRINLHTIWYPESENFKKQLFYFFIDYDIDNPEQCEAYEYFEYLVYGGNIPFEEERKKHKDKNKAIGKIASVKMTIKDN